VLLIKPRKILQEEKWPWPPTKKPGKERGELSSNSGCGKRDPGKQHFQEKEKKKNEEGEELYVMVQPETTTVGGKVQVRITGRFKWPARKAEEPYHRLATDVGHHC